jgi:hypothetical protein
MLEAGVALKGARASVHPSAMNLVRMCVPADLQMGNSTFDHYALHLSTINLGKHIQNTVIKKLLCE